MKRYIEQAWLYYKGQNSGFNFEEFIFLTLLIPSLSLIMYCMTASFGFRTNNMSYWVVGNSFLQCTTTCIFSLGSSFYSERQYGTLRFVIVSPSNKLKEIYLKALFPINQAFITVIFGFVIGSLIFNVPILKMNLLLYFIILIIAMFSACGFGMILSLFGMISSELHMFLNCMSFVMAILTGANFPISMLPKSIQVISKALPLTNSITAVNLLFNEGNTYQIGGLLILELMKGIVYFILSTIIFKIIVRRAIRLGTLDMF